MVIMLNAVDFEELIKFKHFGKRVWFYLQAVPFLFHNIEVVLVTLHALKKKKREIFFFFSV